MNTLIGRKVLVNLIDRKVIATVLGLDTSYPTTALQITWNVQDNPTEDLPADCGGAFSVVHRSHISII